MERTFRLLLDDAIAREMRELIIVYRYALMRAHALDMIRRLPDIDQRTDG
jgi:hypothetical protein